jgi:hypothetical protein
MIASENFTSRGVLETLGSCLTNKYSEVSFSIPLSFKKKKDFIQRVIPVFDIMVEMKSLIKLKH